MLELYAVLYWTFAVAAFTIFAVSYDSISSQLGVKDFLLILMLAALWPVAIIAAIPIYVYRSTILSTKQIRIDLKNRKLLREFEEWLKTKESEAKT